MTFGPVLQDASATRLYTIEWSDWLGADTISTSVWAVSPTGPTISGQTTSGTTASCKLASVTAGMEYTLTNTLTGASGAIEERSIVIRAANQ